MPNDTVSINKKPHGFSLDVFRSTFKFIVDGQIVKISRELPIFNYYISFTR